MVRESHGIDERDMKFKLHCVEAEAYRAVLRAFIAQSDVLSWGKEGLITELRKELHITDIEHREFLMKIDSDESIKMIRDLRKGISSVQESLPVKVNTPGFVPTRGSAPHRKLKTSLDAASTSRKYASRGQPSSTAIPSPLPVLCRGDQQSGKSVMFSMGNAGQSRNTVVHNIQAASVSKGRQPVKSKTKHFHARDVGYLNDRSTIIEICATDKLIGEVESMLYGTEYPNPAQVENAKLILDEQERSILDALAKLTDLSDENDSANKVQHYYSHEELPGVGQEGMMTHDDFYWQGSGEGFARNERLYRKNSQANVKNPLRGHARSVILNQTLVGTNTTEII